MSITITLPDGKTKSFPGPVTGLEVAKSIGPRLAADALGCKVNGELRDLSTVIDKDAAFAVVTAKRRDGSLDPDALFLIRHSAAHVMAEAIQDVVGKQVLLAYGPPTDTGFFYDMYVPADRPISSGDFERINARMTEILKEDRPFMRYELGAEEGLVKLEREANKYKLDNALRALDAVGLHAPTDRQSAPGWARALPIDRLGLSVRAISCLQAGAIHTIGELADKSDLDLLKLRGFGRTSLREVRLKIAELADSRVSASDLSSASTPGGPAVGTVDAPSAAEAQASDAMLSFYATGTPGQNWEDLCRGPHVPSTGRIGAARVMSLASSYWHGDEKSDRLTRVYGTAFPTQEQLDQYLHQLDEAKKRDHRVIGKQMRLFHIDEMVGQGLILWTPNGGVIRAELQKFISEELFKQGYHQVFTPNIGKLELYRTSGHFPYYRESQYPPVIENEQMELLAKEGCTCSELSNKLAKGEVDGYLLKPMNCPHHIKIFASAPHSYRDMPVRLAEFGTVYRWEQSGELNGMTRVRGFTQDDAHLFCTEDQVPAELIGCLSLVKIIFKTLGMKDYRVRVGLRGPDSGKYIGEPQNWDKAEAACIAAAESLGVPFSREPGEAAFYGPKIDFVVKDVIGREWQLGTVQVDYNLPQRFDLSYIGPDNHPHRPVMIHRAPFGSMERFCGVLIEHFAGAFPTWLSPEQVRVLPISEKTAAYAHTVAAALKAARLRARVDESNERIQAKIKVAADEKIPYQLIVGPRDEEQGKVSVRARGIQKDLGQMELDEFVAEIKAEVESRGEGTVVSRFA
jgi:threonyl-tRNA synthetase